MYSKIILGLISGELETAKKAAAYARRMKKCPYLLLHRLSLNKIYSLYAVPLKNKWWLKIPEKYPEKVGLKKATVLIDDHYLFQKDFPARFPNRKRQLAPCGANCENCSLKVQFNCPCCPSTIHYRGRKE